MIGDFLYGLTPSDVQKTPLQIANMRATKASTAPLQEVNFQVPVGFMGHLTHTFALAAGGVGQACSQIRCSLIFPEGIASYANIWTIDRAGFFNRVVNSLNAAYEERVDIWIPEETNILFAADFAGAVNSNQLTASIAILLVPHGNFALGSLAVS